jgi:hypothetical protein
VTDLVVYAEIRARADAATPGPWQWNSYSGICAGVSKGHLLYDGWDGEEGVAWVCWIDNGPYAGDQLILAESKANAAFIEHSRQDIPFLLAELDRLRADRDSLQKQAEIQSATESEALALVEQMRPIVEWAARQEPVVSDDLYDVASCPGCGAEFGVLSLKEGGWDRAVAALEHTPTCSVAQARALLAKEARP